MADLRAPFTATALWTTGPRQAERRTETVVPAPGTVRFRALRTAVSRGTERLVMEGRVPPSEAARMRAPFQDGAFPFPVKYGYMAVGMAESGDHAGRLCLALAPHQDLQALPAAALHPIPEGTPARRAVLAPNMETALTIVWDSGATAGDRIAVIGAGVVGLLTAHLLAQLPGAEVVIADVDPARAPVAAALGLTLVHPTDLPADCDVTINASASPEGLAAAIDAAGLEARVIEASWYGAGTVPVPLGGAFHSRRLTLAASQVGLVPPQRRIRWPNSRRLATALALTADEGLEALITGETPFRDAASDYPRVVADPGTLCHTFLYD